MDRIAYIGHATTLLRLGGATVLTDPMLRGGLGPLRRLARHPDPEVLEAPDVVVVSHLHRDHLDLRSLRRVPASTPVVVPRGGGRWAAKAGRDRIEEIGLGQTIDVGGVAVTGVPAIHDHRRDRWGPGADEALGYVIRGNGRSVYFAGDTDLFEEMSEIGPVDAALLPVAGWGPSVGTGHLDPRAAAVALELVRPRIAVPIHWGTFYPLGLRRLRPRPFADPPHEFARHARELAPEVEVRVLEPGSETSLEAE
jgi:L-ascorbate metabolism protein UlaG (beta-lactamase superfamily)